MVVRGGYFTHCPKTQGPLFFENPLLLDQEPLGSTRCRQGTRSPTSQRQADLDNGGRGDEEHTTSAGAADAAAHIPRAVPPASILPAGADPETHKTGYQEDTPNPFRPLRHPVTGKWHDPKYSLRRQAELVKMARKHGVEELLPEGPKSTEVRLRKRVELGLRVKGTGVGQKVKGHKHERQLGVKMEKRRQAMLDMPELIREWKKVGKRDWTKFPK